MLSDEVLQCLSDEVQKEFNDLEKLEPGSKEYESHVQNIERLLKIAQKEGEFDQKEEDLRRMADEVNYRREQDAIKAEIEKKDKMVDRVITIGTKVLEISIPAAIYVALFNKGLKFEETGIVSSTTNKNLLNKIPNPFKK